MGAIIIDEDRGCMQPLVSCYITSAQAAITSLIYSGAKYLQTVTGRPTTSGHHQQRRVPPVPTAGCSLPLLNTLRLGRPAKLCFRSEANAAGWQYGCGLFRLLGSLGALSSTSPFGVA